jgi:prepilin-type N-terminal cleavage/methylation domain-containing protein
MQIKILYNNNYMKKHNYQKGFTLIEILVVIAIIGILSSVIIAALNSARDKGANALVESQMASLRAQAELIYSTVTPNSYDTVCGDTKFSSMLDNASSTGGNSSGCSSDLNGWSAWAGLKVLEGTNGYWCSGSSGVSKGISTTSSWATSSCQ